MGKTNQTNGASSSETFAESQIADFDNTVNTPQKSSRINWHYGAFNLWKAIKEFFVGPVRSKVQHTTFSDTAETLIDILSSEDKNKDNNKEILEESRQLLDQQKTTDDNWARKRLERWATRLIAFYLIFVFILVLLRGFINICCFSYNQFISDQVMIVILSTTTINIIGLGVIVLKGHFYKDK